MEMEKKGEKESTRYTVPGKGIMGKYCTYTRPSLVPTLALSHRVTAVSVQQVHHVRLHTLHIYAQIHEFFQT